VESTAEVRPSRVAVLAIVLFAAIDALVTIVAIGGYEDSIVAVTHGRSDLSLFWMAYGLYDFVEEDLLGLPGLLAVVWWVSLLLALGGLYHLRPVLRPLRAILVSAVLLKTVAALHHALTRPPDAVIGGVLDSRPVAYPLWALSSIVLIAAAWQVAATPRREAINPAARSHSG
jgi:hypothetical protein